MGNQLLVQFAGLGIYLAWALSLFTLAQQFNEEYAWFAFIPILNLLLMAKIARVSPLWWLLVLTCVGALVYVYYWYKIGQRKGSTGAILGVLTIFPVLNILCPIIIALLPAESSQV